MRKTISINRHGYRAVQLAATAALIAIAGANTARGDVQVTSFETTGFDYAGDAGVTATLAQTTGVTDGANSLHVTAGQSWWINYGFISLPAADVAANTVFKFDITTGATGANFRMIFHPDASPANPWGSAWSGPDLWTTVPAGTSQTVTIDYGASAMPASGSYSVNMQGSFGDPIDFYIDNVRLTGAIPVLDSATGQWAANGSGDWVNAANWSTTDPGPGKIPGGLGSQVTFGNNGGAITTASQIVVTLTQGVSVMNMTFDKGDGGYKIAGNYPVNLSANINVNSGTHQISSAVTVSPGTVCNVAANSSLTIDSFTVNGYNLFTKSGDGTLTVDKVVNTSLTIDAGTLKLKPGNAQNDGFIYALFLNNGSTFDISDNKLKTNSIYTSGTPGNINIGAGGVLTTGLYTDNFTYYGTLSGSGSVVVRGDSTPGNPQPPHTIGFAGSNTYSGTTTVGNLNTLTATSTENLGDGSPTNYLILDNGTFLATGEFTSSRRVNITSLGGTIDTGTFNASLGVVDSGALTKAGTGVLTVTRLENVPTANVAAGVLKIAPNGTTTGTSKIGNLTLGGATSLDLTNNRLIVTGSTLSAVKGNIQAAYASGAWTGAGITSSTAAAVAADSSNTHKTALGYATAGDLGISSFGGQTVAASDVLVRYVYNGDANLDGTVNAMDFNALASSYGVPSAVWNRGDFNFDGSVSTADFTELSANFGQTLAFAAPPVLGTLVPEPASMLVVLLGGMLCARRRH